MYESWARIQLRTPGSAIRLATNLATGPSIICLYTYLKLLGAKTRDAHIGQLMEFRYSKTCVKQPLSKRSKNGFQDQLSLNAGQKYCRMLQREQASILQYFGPTLSYQLSLRSLFCLFLRVVVLHRFYYTNPTCPKC